MLLIRCRLVHSFGRLGISHVSLHRKADGEVNPTACRFGIREKQVEVKESPTCRLGDSRDSAADLVGWTEASPTSRLGFSHSLFNEVFSTGRIPRTVSTVFPHGLRRPLKQPKDSPMRHTP